ncbi:unnamed protein product, partial [Heterosigma akashiwo]
RKGKPGQRTSRQRHSLLTGAQQPDQARGGGAGPGGGPQPGGRARELAAHGGRAEPQPPHVRAAAGAGRECEPPERG